MILERMCNSIKSYTKKALVAGVLLGSIFAATGYNKDIGYTIPSEIGKLNEFSDPNNKNAANRNESLNSSETHIGYNIPAEINKLNELSSPNNRGTIYNRNAILNPSERKTVIPTIPYEINKPRDIFGAKNANEPFLDVNEPSPNVNDVNEPFFSAKELDEINKILSDAESEKENPPFITTVYGEAGYYKGAINENPMLLNVMSSYNLFDKSSEEGALLLMGRVLAKVDKPKNFWNNYVDIAGGIAYQKDSFILGLERVHRELLRKGDKESFKNEGDFLRLWGGYWGMWQLKELEATEMFLDRVWGTNNLQFDYNTLEKNAVADFRADINLDLLNLGDFIIGPFAKGKIDYAARKEPWHGFGEVGAGIRIRNGPFSLFLESGYRGGKEGGSYNAVYGGVWFPIVY